MTSKRLNAIRIMLHQPQVSLYCLNAPHTATNGVIPLSMAAWLNFPNLVQVLLEESADAVAVDGLDAHGATALMCEYFHHHLLFISCIGAWGSIEFFNNIPYHGYFRLIFWNS
jgi:hypothetical protein